MVESSFDALFLIFEGIQLVESSFDALFLIFEGIQLVESSFDALFLIFEGTQLVESSFDALFLIFELKYKTYAELRSDQRKIRESPKIKMCNAANKF